MSELITNARIIRIDRITGTAVDGTETFATGGAIDVACLLDGVSSSQRFQLQGKIKDANWVCYVEKAELAAAGEVPLEVGSRMAVVLDDENGDPGVDADALTGEILLEKTERLEAISHQELYLKVI